MGRLFGKAVVGFGIAFALNAALHRPWEHGLAIGLGLFLGLGLFPYLSEETPDPGPNTWKDYL